MPRQEGRKSYYHVYSMDCSPGIENHAMFLVQSPEDLMIREIDEAAEELLLERLAEAISQLSPTQARRLHARYVLKKKFREIAADEGISGSCASDVIDSRYRSRRPLIVTTNLSLQDLQHPQDTAHARIYDRLLEMCAPIRFSGDNFRRATAQDKLARLKNLMD